MTEAIRTDERYTTAIQSDNLRMDTRDHAPVSDVDVCTAAAWAPARLGSALLRLASEYSRPMRIQGMSETDAMLLMGQLRTMPHVCEQLAGQLHKWGHARPMDVALSVVAWWLHRVCGKCHGRGYDVVPGTARLSDKRCRSCDGAGEARVPHGEHGKRAANYMDECIERARSSMRSRFQHQR